MNHFLRAVLWMCSTVQDCKKQALVGDRGVCSFWSVQHSHPCKSVIEWRVTLGLCLCYPRDDSVTYWYNDPLVKQAEAGPSYRSSARNLLWIHMHSQKMFKYTCALVKYKIKWKKKEKLKLTCWIYWLICLCAPKLTVCTGCQAQGDYCDEQQTRHFLSRPFSLWTEKYKLTKLKY